MVHRWKLTFLILTVSLLAGCGVYEAVRGDSYPPPPRSTPLARPTPPAKTVTRPDGQSAHDAVAPVQLPRPDRASVQPTSLRRSRGVEEPVTAEVTPQGYIVFVQNRLIAVDLTSADGLRIGSVLSLRQGTIPLTHPATGEYLGELNQEIGTARVIELRGRFSVAEIQELRQGFEPKVKDRVVVKPE